MHQIQILIVEDDLFISQDIGEYLQGMDYQVSAVAYNAAEAFAQLSIQQPDLVLLDIDLGKGKDGIDIALKIRDIYQIPFIYLTSYATKSIVERAKYTRPMGYIVKPFDEKDLFAAIEIALFNHATSWQPAHWHPDTINAGMGTDFTAKEVEILQDIYEGKTNRQLCEKHFISLNTVKTHVLRIYEKLDVHSRSEAMAVLRRRLGS